MTMTTKVSKILSITLVLVMLASVFSIFGIQASAASTYSAKSTKQIVVRTGSAWWRGTPSIKIRCDADYYMGNAYAPKLSLKVYNWNTGKTSWATVTGSGRSISSTLRLERNQVYTITVSYIYNASVNRNALQAGGGQRWTDGTWRISSTNNINSYSVR